MRDQFMEGALDADLIGVCSDEGRALVTLDLDFANPLRFRPSRYAGIAVLRLPRRASEAELQELLLILVAGLEREKLEGKLWIVEAGRIRVFEEEAGS